MVKHVWNVVMCMLSQFLVFHNHNNLPLGPILLFISFYKMAYHVGLRLGTSTLKHQEQTFHFQSENFKLFKLVCHDNKWTTQLWVICQEFKFILNEDFLCPNLHILVASN